MTTRQYDVVKAGVAPKDPAARGIAAIFTVTVFISASLLFFVQPMFAKMVLPLLGGAPAVWTTAMLFFQTVLLAGYAYAHFVATRLSGRWQVGLHVVVWALGLAFLPIAVSSGWTYDPEVSPATQTLVVFALGVGMPFFALAANAPLLQKWYARSGGPSASDPYHLYAASNAGSLIALLGYPLLAEPFFGTREISQYWAAGYLGLGLVLGICGLYAARGQLRREPTGTPEVAAIYRPPPLQIARWIGLAFIPSSIMLGVTATISNDIGAFPLVWVLPLALYLLTFVVAFSERLRPPVVVVSTAFLTLVIAALVPMSMNTLPGLGWIGFAVLFAAFFFAALHYHMRLYETRPPEAGLTMFYFAMSVGGALGGLFNSVIAPVVFDSAIETPMVFALAGLALSGQWRPVRDTVAASATVGLVCGLLAVVVWAGSLDPRGSMVVLSAAALGGFALLTARREPLRFTLTAAGFLLVGYGLFWNEGIIHRGRSFFGIYVVRDDAATGMRALGHGTTQHGLQFIEDSGARPRILSYYHPNGPLGQIFLSGEVKPDARIGIVGLGVGALACYAQPGQHWRFYEIDGLIDEIARNTALFSYMDKCAGSAPTILGDARLTLAHDTSEDEKFDLLVIDAYSSDSIPAHLITREALELYFSRLAPGGLLVFHISSRYYQLGPVLGVAAGALGVSALEQLHEQTPEHALAVGEGAAQVAIMAPLPETLWPFADDPRWHVLKPGGGSVWTDDHANILSALRALE